MASKRLAVDRFHSVGNHLAVDFVNTRVASGSTGGSLRKANDVLAFLVEHGALAPRAAAAARKDLHHVANSERFLRRAITLREAIARVLEAIAGARPVARDDLAVLNASLRSEAGYGQIFRSAGESYILAFHRLRSDVTQVLAPIARAAAELLATERPPVRKCANARCIRWFYDDSRTGRRRWCEMGICGNRAKVAAFQRRQRSPAHR